MELVPLDKTCGSGAPCLRPCRLEASVDQRPNQRSRGGGAVHKLAEELSRPCIGCGWQHGGPARSDRSSQGWRSRQAGAAAPSRVARERAEVLVSGLEKRLGQLRAEAQIIATAPNLIGGALVIPAGLLLNLRGPKNPRHRLAAGGH